MKRAVNLALIIPLAVVLVFLPGCGDTGQLAKFSTQPTRATIGFATAIHNDLISLPPPQEKVVVAVYKFRDQTGQYKTSAAATTFSTAVTQGATSMLNKALEDSGWFIPIEREGLPNLLNERKIIRSSRLQYEEESGQKMAALPPMLYAGVLLEGGVIAYDTNFVTGGLGVRYFGIGGSGQLRKDQVTIYLRLVSVKNGQVLKSVSTTKSILSKEVDVGVYRFVSVQKLLEAETGFSTNEPPSMCVMEAIEKAVYDLIIEGIKDGLWGLKDPQDINSPVIQRYLEEKRQTEKIVTFDKKGNLVEVRDVENGEPVLAFLEEVIGPPTPEGIEGAGPEVIEQPEPEIIEQAEPEVIKIPEADAAKQPELEVIKEPEPEVRVLESEESKSVLAFVQEAIGQAELQDVPEPED